jgi:hypothetical protein
MQRILSRLEGAEASEPNTHFRADCRIAWITVLNASRGDLQPFLSATITVLGCHPDQVWPNIVRQRQRLLGQLYEDFYGVNSPPKKPARSATSPLRTDRAA